MLPQRDIPKTIVPLQPQRALVAPNRQRRLEILASIAGHRMWPALAILAALAVLVGIAVPAVLGPRVGVDTAMRGELVQTVVASGHVEAPFRVNIGSQITGVVADVPVAEGQKVAAGQPLIVIDDREARASVAQFEGVVAQAEARLRQIKELTLPQAEATLRQAEATRVNAQQAYDRAAKLARDGYGTRTKLDDAIKARDIAESQVRSAELQVHTSRPGGSDYVMAETQLNQARANLVSAQSRLSYTVITAPTKGVLISRNVERGNVVQPSSVLMTLSPAGDTELVVQIDEKNLSLIALGEKALVSADAYPKQSFEAEVVYINPGIDLQRASVEVKLRVPVPPDTLRQDMTVSVDIEVARRPNAVVIASGSVRDAASEPPWVMKVEAGRTKRQPVQVGISSGGKTEVVSGLAAGDAVVPSNVATVKEGQRVRVIEAKRSAAR